MMILPVALLATLLGAFASPLRAPPPDAALLQDTTSARLLVRADTPSTPVRPDPFPFSVGEELQYEVAFGPFHVGSGSMRVAGIESIRGQPAYHTLFTIHGGTFFYKVDDKQESWFDTLTLSSLRFAQHIHEDGYKRETIYDIFPERSVYLQQGPDHTEQPSVPNPLDDGSFLYFVRTLPLEVGKTYEFQRYFRPDRNPVTIKVLGKERIEVPAGKFDTFVIQPIIKAKGVFSEGGEARIWLTDDDRHMMVQMKSKLSIGSLNLYLTSYKTTPPDSAATGPQSSTGSH